MNRFLTFAKNILVEDSYEVFYMFKKFLTVFPMLLQIFVPLLYLYYRLNYKQIVLYSFVIYVVSTYIKKLSIRVNSTTYSGLPIPRKRLTVFDRDTSTISIKEGMEEEAVQFLYNLEERLTRRGMMNKKKRK